MVQAAMGPAPRGSTACWSSPVCAAACAQREAAAPEPSEARGADAAPGEAPVPALPEAAGAEEGAPLQRASLGPGRSIQCNGHAGCRHGR